MGRFLQLLTIAGALFFVSVSWATDPLSCPSGQEIQYEVIYCQANEGIIGTYTYTENASSCLPVSVGAGCPSCTFGAPKAHPAIQYLSGTDEFWTGIYLPGGTYENDSNYATYSENCVPAPATCSVPSGQIVGNVSGQNSGLGQVCVGNCLANISIGGLIISTKAAFTANMYYAVSTGALCSTATSPDPINPTINGFVQPTTLPVLPLQKDSPSFYQNPIVQTDPQVADVQPTESGSTVSGYTTLNTIETSGGCVTTQDGGEYCLQPTSGQANPAATPDDGTPGVPATPDYNVSFLPLTCTDTNCTLNYYDPTTVSQSTNEGAGGTLAGICAAGDSKNAAGECASTGQCPAGQTLNSSGYCAGAGNVSSCGGPGQPACNVNISGDTAGVGLGGGGGVSASQMPGSSSNPATVDCTASGTCTGATGDFTDTVPSIPDFSASYATFQAAVAASPIVQAMSSVGSAIPTGGTPPSATITAFNQTYVLASPDAVNEAVIPVLELVMKAVWSLIAIRRFMAA